MYWLSTPPLSGLIAPCAPCVPIPIMLSPNSTIPCPTTPRALTSRALTISRNPKARSRNASAAPTS
jgi:hypothetical protein